jgi:hypothetical protein
MTEDELGPEARIGRVLDGKWTLEKLLGVGGMAAVYSARHRNGARAAVKILHAELAKHKEIRDRFLREGYAANRVGHPGAVSVLDDDVVKEGPDAGAAYIVMELLEGELLEERAARGTIPETELLAIADSVLDCLEAAHTHGVIHRDLKPDNLFILRGEPVRVKVLDFGLARITEGRIMTRAGVTLGTPAYMSPEQAAGRADEIDGRADIFSLGAVMFRLRTGKRIHEAPTPVELVGKMAREPAPPIRTVDREVSAEFASVVDRALSFGREDRYPDARAMRNEVKEALEKLAPPPPPPMSARFEEPEKRGSFPWLFILLLAAGAGYVFYRYRGTTQTPVAVAPPASESAVVVDSAAEAAADTAVEDVALAAAIDASDADADEEEEEEEDEDADVDADVDADAESDADAADATDADGEVGDAHATAASVLKNLLNKPPPTATAKKPAPPPPKPVIKKKKRKKKKK